MSDLLLAYVAGPYRADTEHEVLANIRSAEAVALELWKLGIPAICPHKNTALFGGACPDSWWLEGDLEILKRCDLLVLAPRWWTSKGTDAEIREAGRLGLPIFIWHWDRAQVEKLARRHQRLGAVAAEDQLKRDTAAYLATSPTGTPQIDSAIASLEEARRYRPDTSRTEDVWEELDRAMEEFEAVQHRAWEQAHAVTDRWARARDVKLSRKRRESVEPPNADPILPDGTRADATTWSGSPPEHWWQT